MALDYFKTRKPFDFSPHPFDIGNILGLKKGFGNNHFLLKIYGLDQTQFEAYYTHHLTYFLSTGRGIEKEFLAHVWYIIQKRIEYFERKDPFSSKHPLYVSNIEKLTEFQQFLATHDQWHIRPNDALLKEKEERILALEKEIADLKAKAEELSTYKVAQKIMVYDNHVPTLIDIMKQLQSLELPNGKALLRSDHKSPYYKIIANYFCHDGKDIPENTLRNYFVGKEDDIAVKGSRIPKDKKLFRIVPIEK